MKRLLTTLLITTTSLWAQTNTAEFYHDTLKKGFGVRAITMGHAYTALAEEGGGMSYNPAGMAIPGSFVSWENFDSEDDVYRDSSAQSIYISPMGVSNWRTKTTDGQELHVNTIAYAKKGRRHLTWGIALKKVTLADGDHRNNYRSGDLGFLYQAGRHTQFGLVGKDIFKDDLPIASSVAAGLARFSHDRSRIFTLDIVQNRFNPDQPTYEGRLGAEVHISDGLVLRAGWSDERLSGGAGFIFKKFELDVGMVNDQSNQDISTQYLFGLKMGKGVQTNQHRRQYAL